MGTLNYKSVIWHIVLFGVLFIASGAWAKSLFVASNGSDAVSYVSNSITSPWASPKFAWENAQPGDTVYFRGGTYNIPVQVNTQSVGYNGTSLNPITFKNYNNETVVFTSTLPIVFSIQKNYNYVEGIICDGLGTGGSTAWWKLAENLDATNFKATRLVSRNIGEGTDNQGFIYLQASRANNAIIEYCTIVGPGQAVNANVAGIIIFRTQGVKIRNNDISNVPNGIYYKHSNTLADTGIEIYNNYIHDCGRNGIQSVSNYGYYHDNLLVGANAVFGIDGGSGDGYVGADYNRIIHNTFYKSTLNFTYETNATDPNKGCLYNIVKDNIIMQKGEWHRYTSLPHNTVSDYNLFAPGNIIIENRIDYTLTSWKMHSGGDSHSISGTPTFVKTTPVLISDFVLAANSLGKNSASDGKDMGAEICKVGVNPSCSGTSSQKVPANPPSMTVQ